MTAKPIICLAGLPGSGKTTLAGGLSAAMGWPVLSASAIAAAVDPGAGGDMANEALFAPAFELALDAHREVIVDGAPRRPGQLAALPADALIFAMFCRRDVAVDRMHWRRRPMDDGLLAGKRWDDQAAELEWYDPDGWLRKAVPWQRFVNTDHRGPEKVLGDVLAYLDGAKKEAF